MIKVFAYFRIALVTVGIYFGFYYLNDPVKSLHIITLFLVGVVGVISFVTHVPLHKQDADRLGWQTDRPDWQFEVGFANLAFGIAGFVASCAQFGTAAMAIVVLAYAFYLLQAAILHGINIIRSKPIQLGRFIRSSILTFIYSGMMIFFALAALKANSMGFWR